MPMLGLGVWQVPSGAACVNAVRSALDLGYGGGLEAFDDQPDAQ